MDTLYGTIDYRGYVIKIYVDEHPYDPRGDCNLGTMVCCHRRYTLGDEQIQSRDEIDEDIINRKGYIALPLYIFDHSGISMSTNPYSRAWDSGQVGYIYVSCDMIRKEWGVKRISSKLKRTIIRNLQCEVEEYDNYLRGEVYGYQIKFPDDDDSCWGFSGSDHEKSGLIDSARDAIDFYIIKSMPLFAHAGIAI